MCARTWSCSPRSPSRTRACCWPLRPKSIRKGLGNARGPRRPLPDDPRRGRRVRHFRRGDAASTSGAFGGQLVNQDSYPKLTHAKSGALRQLPVDHRAGREAQRSARHLHLARRPFRCGPACFHEARLPRLRHHDGRMRGPARGGQPRYSRGHAKTRTACHRRASRTPRTRTPSPSGRRPSPKVRPSFEAAGAPEVWNNPPGSMHIMGGTDHGPHAQRTP